MTLCFSDIERRAQAFASHISASQESIIDVLLDYESHEVATDEIDRTLDLLLNLAENRNYFQRGIGSVAVFLPRNQPVYAMSCFAVVPSLMAEEVISRPPVVMRHILPNLLKALDLQRHFPNIHFSFQQRQAFVKERATSPKTNVVIFTGSMPNADSVRKVFSDTTLFIANGSGHNPIIVTNSADLERAVESILRIQLYNSGQDCANADSILVHSKCYDALVKLLRDKVSTVQVGTYRLKQNRVGPLTDHRELKRLQRLLEENRKWIDDTTEGVIRIKTAIVEPTIILKPLCEGGNYSEFFAPIFMVQRYDTDGDLEKYFYDPRYEDNAMYITVFGHSLFVDGLVGRRFSGGKVLHDEGTIIRDTDLHAKGVERGTQPYGGYGRGASCVSLNGRVIPMPTCPQRDIYDFLVRSMQQDECKVSSFRNSGG